MGRRSRRSRKRSKRRCAWNKIYTEDKKRGMRYRMYMRCRYRYSKYRMPRKYRRKCMS